MIFGFGVVDGRETRLLNVALIARGRVLTIVIA